MFESNLPKFCILAGLAVPGWAQLAAPAREIPLYPGAAPGSENWKYPERTAGTPERPQAHFKPEVTASARKAGAPTTTWTGWRSGSS